MWILWNILLSTFSSRVWIFFDVWNTMVHATTPQKYARYFLGWFLIFVDFLPKFQDFKPIFASHDNLQQKKIKKFISIVQKWMTNYHVSWYLAMGGPQEYAKIQKWAKKSPRFKISQKVSCNFLRHVCMSHSVSYIKKIQTLDE